MQAHTKKHPTEDMVTLRLKVHRHNASLIMRYAESVESEEERTYTVAEVFPEYIGKESQVALRAYWRCKLQVINGQLLPAELLIQHTDMVRLSLQNRQNIQQVYIVSILQPRFRRDAGASWATFPRWSMGMIRQVDDHIVDVTDMIEVGKGAKREVNMAYWYCSFHVPFQVKKQVKNDLRKSRVTSANRINSSFPRAAWECSDGAPRHVSRRRKHGPQPLPDL